LVTRVPRNSKQENEMLQLYYRFVDATSGGRVYHAHWMSKLGIPPVPAWTVLWAIKLWEIISRRDRDDGRRSR
jgi:hypothetical protein